VFDSVRECAFPFFFVGSLRACANFVRRQFTVKISAHFVIPPARRTDSVLPVVSV